MENKRKAEQELKEAESEQNRLNEELTTAANAVYEAGPSYKELEELNDQPIEEVQANYD